MVFAGKSKASGRRGRIKPGAEPNAKPGAEPSAEPDAEPDAEPGADGYAGRFGLSLERLNEALANHGAFEPLVPNWLWAEHQDDDSYTRYEIVRFETRRTQYVDTTTGRKSTKRSVHGIGRTLFSSLSDAVQPEVEAIPLEYLLDEQTLLSVRAVEPLPHHPDHIAVSRAHEVANYPEDVRETDAVLTLDLHGRNIAGILKTGKWKRHQIYVCEMNPMHAMFMRLNNVANVVFTPNGIEEYILSDAAFAERLRSRVRVVYADYCGHPGRRLVEALRTLPRLASYSVNVCLRGAGGPAKVDAMLAETPDDFRQYHSPWKYDRRMVCYFMGRRGVPNHYRN